jgi:hypothetical protein
VILKKGKPSFVLLERIECHTAELALYSDGDPERNSMSVLYLVRQISWNEMTSLSKKKRDLRGIPSFFALNNDGTSLFIWPVPSGDIHAVFTYCPARKRI